MKFDFYVVNNYNIKLLSFEYYIILFYYQIAFTNCILYSDIILFVGIEMYNFF